MKSVCVPLQLVHGYAYPIEERASNETRPANVTLLALEIVGGTQFCCEHRNDGTCAGVSCVAAKFRGDEAFHARGNGGVDELVLVS
jgi:hypothetical protein